MMPPYRLNDFWDPPQILCKLQMRHEQSRIHCARQRIYPTAATRVSMGGVKAMKFLRFVAGAACAPAERVSFERMRQVAERICAAHESEPADAVLLSEEEYRWDDVELSGARPERLVSQPLEAARLMSEEDKDVALDCLRIMLRAESTDASVDAVLARLGQYFPRRPRLYTHPRRTGADRHHAQRVGGKGQAQHPAKYLRQARQPLPRHRALCRRDRAGGAVHAPAAGRTGRGRRGFLAIRHLPYGETQRRGAAFVH